MKVTAVIPAAGSGKRTGSSTPKQYLKFKGKELLALTLEVFQKNRLINDIIVAVHPDYLEKVAAIKKKYNISKLRKIVIGGNERQDSVNAALSFLSDDDGLAVVHDAARPLLPQAVLTKAIKHAKDNGSALVALKAKDTLLKTGKKNSYPDRTDIYYVQTPQIFKVAELKHAFALAKKKNFKATDESMLMQFAGYPVSIVEGSILNFKVTSAEDVITLKSILRKSK